jgi:hypothetical protein
MCSHDSSIELCHPDQFKATIMSIYVTTQPEIVNLAQWSIRASDKGERHFVGFHLDRGDGRVSTPIREFDPVTRTGRTASGSTYHLIGRAGRHSDAEYVWRIAAKAWGIEKWADITAELVPNWREDLTLPSESEGKDEDLEAPEC